MIQPQGIDFEGIRQSASLVDHVATVAKVKRAGSEYEACCPFHADRSPSFRIYANGSRWICHAGCGGGDVIDFVRRLHQVGTVEAARLVAGCNLPSGHIAAASPSREPAERTEEARSIWRNAVSATDTLAEAYLRSRGLHLPIPESIRFARLPYGARGQLHPVLVAVVASAADQLIGIQRTYLNAAGSGKAAVPKPKLSLGRVGGGAIRLAPAARAMIITEGLEDGVTLQQEFGRATWVAAGAGNMATMILPAGVEAVTIGGDADQPGREAAAKAVDAFKYRGLHAKAIFPAGAKDFNAELVGRAQS